MDITKTGARPALAWVRHPRRLAGCALCLLGCAVLLATLAGHAGAPFAAAPHVRAALVGGSTAAAATALGTLPILLAQNFSSRTYDCFLGFGAGVMLGATAFSLVIPALAAARTGGAGSWGASLTVGAGIMAGSALLLVLDRFVTTDGMLAHDDPHTSHSLKRAWLFVWPASFS
jgi:ZIP family zinc transporter